MSEFKREKRYQVIKLSNPEWSGSCVVVEDDWPEYEIVWKMIQDRVEGKPNIIEQLQQQVVMKFSEERVPQFSQGYKSHELLEPVTAEDCTFYVGRIEQLQADNARLREAWKLQAVALREEATRIRKTVKQATGAEERCNVRAEIYDKCAAALASTNGSNWLAEQKAQWRREVLEEAAIVGGRKAEGQRIPDGQAVADAIRRMAEQPESKGP